MFETILELDKIMLLYLNGLGSSVWDGFWVMITREKTPIPLYFLVLFVCYRNYGLKQTFGLVLVIVAFIAMSDQLSNLFKNILIKRPRPCHNVEIAKHIRSVEGYCGGLYGYFSAHASNSFTFATFFGLLFWKFLKWFSIILFVWALLTSYSRIYLGVHYPLDVFTGIILGVALGVITWHLWKKLKTHKWVL